MKSLILIFILLFGSLSVAAEKAAPPGKAGQYFVNPEANLGYGMLQLKNPNGSKALYDGVGIRASLNIPLIDLSSLDVYFSPMMKYLDLKNTANSSSQYESANIFGPGLGLSVNLSNLWFGANYNKMWARHAATGSFNGRTEYSFQALEYFGGVHWQFDKLGVGVMYSYTGTSIPKEDTGLTKDTPFEESMISLQLTFSLGQTTWQVLQSLF